MTKAKIRGTRSVKQTQHGVNTGEDIARELIPYAKGMYKFGRNPITPATDEDVWDGSNLYTWLSAAETVSFASADTDEVGTLEAHGLDADFNEIVFTGTIAGDVAITSTAEFIRLNRMKFEGAAVNVGIISAVTDTGGVTMAQINAGMGQTLMAIYTIPNGYYGILKDVSVSMGQTNKTANGRMFMRNSTGSWQVKHTIEAVGGEVGHKFEYFPKIPAKTDIRWNANMGVGETNQVSADFTIHLYESDT